MAPPASGPVPIQRPININKAQVSASELLDPIRLHSSTLSPEDTRPFSHDRASSILHQSYYGYSQNPSAQQGLHLPSDRGKLSDKTSELTYTDQSSQINQQIASELDTDQDICNFRLICRDTHDAIDADGCSFWRRRFLAIFETPQLELTGQRVADNEKFRDVYKKRKNLLKNGVLQEFRNGLVPREQQCLELIRDLIIGEYRMGNFLCD